MCRVSIIIPVYNEEKYICRCIESILYQTLDDIEIICIDDGSTDDSLNLIKKMAVDDRRIRIIQQKNMYAGVARNRGIEVANGKYLYFMDADDYVDSNMLDNMYNMAEKNKSDIVVCRFDITNDKGENIPAYFANKKDLLPKKEIFKAEELKYAAVFQFTMGVAWDKLFRTDFIKKCALKFQPLCVSNDGFFSFCSMIMADRISYTDYPFVHYRMGNKNSLSLNRTKHWEDAFVMLSSINEKLIDMGCYETYKRSFLNYVMSHETGYLKSLKGYKEFVACYNKIKNLEGSKYQLMNYERSYFFDRTIYDYYNDIVNLEKDCFLFKNLIISVSKNEKKGWVFPFEKIDKDSFIAIYGAGVVGDAYYSQAYNSSFCKKIIRVDKNYKALSTIGREILSPEEIISQNPDYVVIAIEDETMKDKVRAWLMEEGIPEATIIY